jgi:actin cytoskeleton-regulatory complex protein PAN1
MSNMAIYMVRYLSYQHMKLFDNSKQTYCVNQGAAINVLRSLREKTPELASHLQVKIMFDILVQRLRFDSQRIRDDPAVRNLDLSSYLLVPSESSDLVFSFSRTHKIFQVQRMTKYPLLIRQVCHNKSSNITTDKMIDLAIYRRRARS